MKNIADLREHLFKQLEALDDPSRKVDLRRMRLTADIAGLIIDAARVEVQFATVVKGAADLPFIESQDPDHPSNKPERPKLEAVDPMTRTAQILTAGPASTHPWRESAKRREG
ncbi:hypothetical protein QTI51_37460 [Variovorax sp. J22G73]|uniref:hypothetical protein n=1 Tax=unclassified Variovorax TaxID=663243 RepID=UPI0025754C7E|nr:MULTISPECIES: hypothetical protein [unclassified Variovorax]MDM0010126.1 hypothetical protein [Variovorax sp. J22R203]MDM0103014.1 hypothetical protein [Variovorax sp. J22G73]